MKTVSYLIPGRPIPWKRPKVFSKLNMHKVYDTQKDHKIFTGLYLTKCHGDNPPFTLGPLHLDAKFYFEPAKSIPYSKRLKIFNTYHTLHLDLDNLLKYILDTLVQTETKNSTEHILIDDSIVVSITASKHWSQTSRTELILSEIPQ